VLQYILLGALEGAALDILYAINTFVAGRKDKGFVAKHSKKVIMLLNWTFVMAGIILYEDIFSLFPIVGAILQTSAFWITKEKTIRFVSLLGAPFWLVYNLANEAYGSAIGNTLAIISLLIAIYRYDIKPGIKKQELPLSKSCFFVVNYLLHSFLSDKIKILHLSLYI